MTEEGHQQVDMQQEGGGQPVVVAEQAQQNDTAKKRLWSQWHTEHEGMEWHLRFAELKPALQPFLERIAATAGEAGLRVLDVGCGTSALGVQVMEELSCREVVLLDVVEPLVCSLQTKYGNDPRVKPVLGDCQHLSKAGLTTGFHLILDKGTFDVLDSEAERDQMMNGVLELVERPGGIIVSISFASAARVLWLRRRAASAGMALHMRALPAMGQEVRLLTVFGGALPEMPEDELTKLTLSRLLYSGPLRDEPTIAFQDARLTSTITVLQEAPGERAAGEDATGRVVWPAAHAFAAYLCENRHLVEGKNVVELGAGTGLAGLVAAGLGAKAVVLTDLPSAMPLLQRNIAANADACGHRARGEVLWWGSEVGDTLLPCDVVMGCEVIYQHDADTSHALVETMATLAGTSGICLMVYEFREGMLADAEFFDCVNEQFEVEVCCLDQYGFRNPLDDDGSRLLYIYRPKAAVK